jgi:hypothetical protein
MRGLGQKITMFTIAPKFIIKYREYKYIYIYIYIYTKVLFGIPTGRTNFVYFGSTPFISSKHRNVTGRLAADDEVPSAVTIACPRPLLEKTDNIKI